LSARHIHSFIHPFRARLSKAVSWSLFRCPRGIPGLQPSPFRLRTVEVGTEDKRPRVKDALHKRAPSLSPSPPFVDRREGCGPDRRVPPVRQEALPDDPDEQRRCAVQLLPSIHDPEPVGQRAFPGKYDNAAYGDESEREIAERSRTTVLQKPSPNLRHGNLPFFVPGATKTFRL